jgi:hypothetical protein
MEDKIAGSLAGIALGAIADAVLVRLGFPKHTAKVLGGILGALLT